MDTPSTTLRESALHLAARGWHVFPITPGTKKPPVIDRWETRASTDPNQIHHWWREIPYSIGIATGPSGLVVVDLDTRKPGQAVPSRWATLGISSGAAVLRTLAHHHDAPVTPTYAVSTPSGGWHLYYTAPAGTPLRNTQAMIGWKIDTRAHGGYVIAPGCPVSPSGYALVDDRDPVELPGWLHHALIPKPPTAHSAPATPLPTVQLNQAELVYVLVPAGNHSFYEPAFMFSGMLQVNGQTYVKRILVPAIDPSQRTP